MESTGQNMVYASSDVGDGSARQHFDTGTYAVPDEASDGASHAYATILDSTTGLPYEVPLDPATSLPYETPLDGSDENGYKVVTNADGNCVQGRHGYDGNLTHAGHYSQGYDSQLTTGSGYDSQLTDPDYARLRSRVERSTQRRPASVSTVENAVYTAGGTACPPAQTMTNAVYAVPMETTAGGGIYAVPLSGADDAPTYGAVHDFQHQVRRTRITHIVDDIAYVTAPRTGGDGADYSQSAAAPGNQGGGMYSDVYAQEAVNALSNYTHVQMTQRCTRR